jgi:hypothetical protein
MLNKLIENKNFYYVMIVLTVIHIFMYLFNKTYTAVAVLILSSIIVYNFNKKPVIVLLTSLILTHIFVANKRLYEGLENNNEIKNNERIDKLKNTDPELAESAKKLDKDSVDEKKQNIKQKIKDQNNPDMNKNTTDENEPIPESFEVGRKGAVRLDHAATIETAYDDLQNILGSDGIGKLTDDTKKLMNQQKNLFEAMNQLAPAVKETMGMLEGLDLNGITNMSSSTSKVADQLKNLMSSNNIKASNDKTVKK